jgi:hypothetical protein
MKIGTIEIDLWSKPAIIGSGPPAINTERMIEVPLGLWFINKFKPELIEIGAVTPYYHEIKHTVIDPNDPWPHCIKNKAEDLNYTGLNILSISTIEHIYKGEYGQPDIPEKAIEVLQKMMQSNNWLITWAAGYHKYLDIYVEQNNLQSVKLHRTEFNKWAIVPSLLNYAYNEPFPFGNAIYLITNCKELLSENT